MEEQSVMLTSWDVKRIRRIFAFAVQSSQIPQLETSTPHLAHQTLRIVINALFVSVSSLRDMG